MEPATTAPPTPPCRCCGSTRVTKRGTKRGTHVQRDFHYYDCADCTFLFVEPVTNFSIYDDAYYAGRGVDPFVNYQAEYATHDATPRLAEFEDLFRLATTHLRHTASPPTDHRVTWLDFGCGAGGLLKFLRARDGFDRQGQRIAIDITGHDVGSYAQRLQRDDNFTILDFDAFTALPAGSFDIITCIEVLEHIPEPRPLIALLARLLRPGGLLILTTGNLASPMARWQGLGFGYLLPEIHVSLFNPTLLASLYEQVGLHPRHLRYDGAIRFRILKTLRPGIFGRIIAQLVKIPLVVRIADVLYGTSAMPCAVKPADCHPQSQ